MIFGLMGKFGIKVKVGDFLDKKVLSKIEIWLKVKSFFRELAHLYKFPNQVILRVVLSHAHWDSDLMVKM